MKEEYEFGVKYFSTKRYIERFETNTNLEIEGNILKINQIEKMKGVIKRWPNPTGYYDIYDIKDIKKSSMFWISVMAMAGWIILTILFVLGAITFPDAIFNSDSPEAIIMYAIVSLSIILFCRAGTIKIVFKDGKKIQIPVKMLKYKSKEYKQNVENCIEEIKRRMK